MRRTTFIGFLFAIGAIAAGLVWPIRDIYAKPMVECRNGQCVISEEDWKRFQEFHRQTLIARDRIEQGVDQINGRLEGTEAELARCKSRLERRPV